MLNQPLISYKNRESFVITIIGFGNVGRTVLYSLLLTSSQDTIINIIDPSDEISGSVCDLGPITTLNKSVDLTLNNEALFNESDVIFYCAGKAIPKNETRSFNHDKNISLAKEIFRKFNPTKLPLIIITSNPHEIICQVINNHCSIPGYHVVGTGTLTDTMRFEYFLAEETKERASQINGWILGKHGDQIVPILSHSTIKHQPIEQILNPSQIEKVLQKVKQAAEVIKATQEASYYTAANAALFVFNSYYSIEQNIMPLAVYNASKCIYSSTPVKVGKGSITLVSDFGLTPKEQLDLNEVEDQLMKDSLLLTQPSN